MGYLFETRTTKTAPLIALIICFIKTDADIGAILLEETQ
jgi:hypothetical protein